MRETTGAMTQSMKVKIEAMTDGDIGEEMLVLDIALAGMVADNGLLSETDAYRMASTLTIADGTTPMVSVKDDAYDAIARSATLGRELRALPLNSTHPGVGSLRGTRSHVADAQHGVPAAAGEHRRHQDQASGRVLQIAVTYPGRPRPG